MIGDRNHLPSIVIQRELHELKKLCYNYTVTTH